MDDVYCSGGNPLDRASERRDDGEWIAKLLGDPETRLLALRDLKPFTRGTSMPPYLTEYRGGVSSPTCLRVRECL
jgi:hypothetical protein